MAKKKAARKGESVTVKLIDLIKAQMSFEKIISANIPVAQAFKIKRATRGIKQELESYHEHRIQLIKEIGKEKNGQWEIDMENEKAVGEFNKQHKDLSGQEITFDVIKLSIGDLEGIKMSAMDLDALEFLIDSAS